MRTPTLDEARIRLMASEARRRGLSSARAPLPVIDKVRRIEGGFIDPECPVANELTEMAVDLSQRPEVLRRALASGFYELTNEIIAPGFASAAYAWFHRRAWDWWYDSEQHIRPLVMCLPRGAAKTTTLQLILAHAGMAHTRPYALYVQSSQADADKKIEAVGKLLASEPVREAFPSVSETYKSEKGVSRDWRKGRIRTASNFTLDAFGMDSAIRGAKVDEDRPGIIIIDDIEDHTDTPYMTKKRTDLITKSVIQAASDDAIIVFIQNKIKDNSIMATMLDGRADFLTSRLTIGPVKQIEDLEIEEEKFEENGIERTYYRIVGGTPSWPEGLGLEASEKELNDGGPTAFKTERQHETTLIEGDMFPSALWPYVELLPLSGLRFVRSWDLAGTSKGGDYTVGVLMAHHEASGAFFVVDVVRGQWSMSEVEDVILETAVADEAEYGSFWFRILIESQIGIVGSEWNKRWTRDILSGHPVKMVPPQGNKKYRADAYSAMAQRGGVALVHAEWNAPFIREHSQFPDFGDNDDQVDAAAYGFNELTKGRRQKGKVRSAAGRTI